MLEKWMIISFFQTSAVDSKLKCYTLEPSKICKPPGFTSRRFKSFHFTSSHSPQKWKIHPHALTAGFTKALLDIGTKNFLLELEWAIDSHRHFPTNVRLAWQIAPTHSLYSTMHRKAHIMYLQRTQWENVTAQLSLLHPTQIDVIVLGLCDDQPKRYS
jgi:hypothetical protein